MSGAGKSTVLDALEDMGWDCVDNLPVALLERFRPRRRGSGGKAPVAVGMDARSRGFDAEKLPAIIRSIEDVRPEILFLDCSGTELVRRYDETRRRHPLAADRPPEDGIARERGIIARIRNRPTASSKLPTSRPPNFARNCAAATARTATSRSSPSRPSANARGVSRTADLMFDMRFVANPHWVEELRPLTGLDQQVRDYCGTDRPGAGRWTISRPF